MGSIKGVSVDRKIPDLSKIKAGLNDVDININEYLNNGSDNLEELSFENENVLNSSVDNTFPSDEEIEENAEKEEEVIEGLDEDTDELLIERAKKEYPDLQQDYEELKNIEDMLKDYKAKKEKFPSDYSIMSDEYNRFLTAPDLQMYLEDPDSVKSESQRKAVEEALKYYDDYAKKYGYDSMAEMDTIYLSIPELECSKRVLKRKIKWKNSLIEYVCKYGDNAKKFVHENDYDDPLKHYADDYSNGRLNSNVTGGKVYDPKIVHLFEASQEDHLIGEMYHYIYKTEGEEAANEYLDSLEEYINQMAGLNEAKKFLDSLEGAGDIEQVLSEFGEGFGDGVEGFGKGIARMFSDNANYDTLDFKKAFILYFLTNDPKYSEIAYECGLGAGGVFIPLSLALVLPGSVGVYSAALVSGMSVTGNTIHNNLVNGVSLGDARAYGIQAGIIESTTWIMGSKLNSLCQKYFSMSIKSFLSATSASNASVVVASFFAQVQAKTKQLLKSGDYYSKYPNKEEAYKAAYKDAYESLGGDKALVSKLALALVLGGIINYAKYDKIAADNGFSPEDNKSLDDVIDDETAKMLEEYDDFDGLEDSTIGGDNLGRGASPIAIGTADTIFSFIKSMASTSLSTDERKK